MNSGQNVKWFNELKVQHNAGISNAFLLSGNIRDYVIPGKDMITFLKDRLLREEVRFISFNHAEGSTTHADQAYPSEQTRDKDWQDILQLLRSNEEGKKNVVVIEYPEYLIPASFNGYIDDLTKTKLIELQKLLNDPAFISSDNILLFVTEARSSLDESFMRSGSRLSLLNVEFPNEEEREAMIAFLIDSSKTQIEWEVSPKELARLTAGLTRVHLEDLMLLAEYNGRFERSIVLERKEELIKKEFGEVIEIYNTDGYSLDDFTGQEHIKRYHRESIIEPLRSGDTKHVPKGVMYMGPPGTGKTYFSKCLAGDSGINFVEFRMSKILGKWVGEAEKNLEKAFNCFTSLAPVGVFIDEMDQVLSRGSEQDGNSVNKNLFGMFLSFISNPDNRGKIIWIAATNYPNKIDEALKRAGRFDKKLAFFPPTLEEREEVFAYHVQKTGLATTGNDYRSLAELTDGYTPAEIENIVVKALEIAHRKNLQEINTTLLVEAKNYMLKQSNEKIEEMIDIALRESNDLEFIPHTYHTRLRNVHQSN